MFIKQTKNVTTLYQGHCIECLQDIADESIDLIFADPPYNIGKQFGDFHDSWTSDKAYAEWCYQWLQQCINKLKPNGSLYVMTSTQAMPKSKGSDQLDNLKPNSYSEPFARCEKYWFRFPLALLLSS
jgi:DNA modification methylase